MEALKASIPNNRRLAMLISEDEARKKLCPERCYGQLRVLCEGTDCMAFRIVKVETIDHKKWGPEEKPRVWGYCGLAGTLHRRRWSV
jgi:hypothetical protein